MENYNKEQINKEQISPISEKKTWAMPELIVIDKKVIEGGPVAAVISESYYNNVS